MIGVVISIIALFIFIGIVIAICFKKPKVESYADFEVDKQQDIILDKLINNVTDNSLQITSLNKNMNSLQSSTHTVHGELTKQVSDMSAILAKTNNQTQKSLQKQTSQTNSLIARGTAVDGQIKSINDSIVVINGRLVEIGDKHAERIEILEKDATQLKTQQSSLQDFVTQSQGQIQSSITSQTKNLTDFQNQLTDQVKKQQDTVDKVYNSTSSIENIIFTLNTSLDNLKQTLKSYINREDIKQYMSKDDMKTYDARFDDYLSKTDFNTFKASLPDYPTRTEMAGLVNSFLTQKDIVNIQTSVGNFEASLHVLSGLISEIKTRYATKDDMMKLSDQAKDGMVNIQGLTVTLAGLQQSLTNVQGNITEANMNLSTYKADAEKIFAKKQDLEPLKNAIDATNALVQTYSGNIKETLKVTSSFEANGDVLLNNIRMSKNFTGYSDAERSEISNDTNQYKKLMIAGNRADGGNVRRVGVADQLDVHGGLTVDKSIQGQNIVGQESIGVADRAWMKKDGSIYAAKSLGVGTTDTGKKMFGVTGGVADDWIATFHNTIGNRSVSFNHGDGHGMKIDTNDTRADRYGLQITNGKNPVLNVYNDGRIVSESANAGDWNFYQKNTVGGEISMNHGAGHGMKIATNNDDRNKYGLQVTNNKNELMGVMNDGSMRVRGSINVLTPDIGPMIERNFGGDDHRYGLGQFSHSKTRVYAPTGYNGTVNLSLAKPNNTFDDVITVNKDNATINKDLRVNGSQICLNNNCMTSSDITRMRNPPPGPEGPRGLQGPPGQAPAVPVFIATLTYSYNLPYRNMSVVVFNSVENDTNNFYNPNNGQFKPRIAGYYQLNFSVIYDKGITNNAGTGEIFCSFYKNENYYQWGSNHLSPNQHYGCNVGSCLMFLNGVNDYATIRMYQFTDQNQTIIVAPPSDRTNPFVPRFSGFLVRTT